MTHIIAIANQKGGVGKTTTALNLCASLAAMQKKVLLIDLDPQGNATTGYGIDKHKLDYSICEVLLNECSIEQAIVNGSNNSYQLIASNADLIAAEVSLVKNNHSQFALNNALSKISRNYDFIFIDCPPSLNMLTINAFSATNGIIIPMQCEYYSLEGLSSLINTIERIQDNINKQLAIIGIVRTMFDSRTKLANEVSIQLSKYFQNKLFKTIVPRNIKLAESPSFGKSTLVYAKNSKGAIAYLSLATELVKNLS